MRESRMIELGLLGEISGFRIRLAEQLAMQSFAMVFEGTGLTPARFSALELIHRNPGIRPAELAGAMMAESSNMAVLLRQLENGGWIETRPGNDRRSKTLFASDSGRRKLEGLRQRLATQDHMLTKGLTDAERIGLNAQLDRLIREARHQIREQTTKKR